MNQAFTTHSTLPSGNTTQNLANSKTPVSFINSSASQAVRSINGSSSNLTNSPRQVTLTKSNSPINNLTNVAKGIAMSPAVSYQSKKPIPIQPKNPVILPNTSIQSGINVRGNVHHVSQAPTSLMSNQTHTSVISNQLQMSQAGVLARGHTPKSINGIDTSKTRATPLQSTRTTQPTILATPPKRIAPKQVISPSTNASLAMSSPVRLQQANIPNTQNVQLATQLIQAPVAQSTPNSASKLFPQQLTSIVRPLISSNQGTTIATSTAQPVQQIQQLINDKLSVQQTQPSSTVQVQQKVFTQTQLQTALKQSQLIAQNSPGQPQNILVQQQILKQLIQQAQQLQQQKPPDKTVNVTVQPISTNATGLMNLQQPTHVVKQTVQTTLPQQVTVANQIVGNNQIQMVLPNKQIVTLTPSTMQANQQAVNVAQNIPQVSAVKTTQNLASKGQQMIIVSQAGGNFVLQQNVQPSSAGLTTTAGTTVNIPIQSLLQSQQKQLTTQSIPTQQQVKTSGNTILQVQQAKQITQPAVVIQNQAIQRQNVTPIKQGNTQQNIVIQTKPGVMATQGGTTIQQLTPAQLQQLQNSGSVQKVLIIKQPEVLQKLANVQGGKSPQAIQITPQQLQALQQMQNQQTSTAQKIIIQSKGDGTNPTTTVLTAQQLKQLQQSLQQQVGGNKIVQIPQKQTLVQQIQQQNTKTPAKMAHVPRILQTSGRQVTSQVREHKLANDH